MDFSVKREGFDQSVAQAIKQIQECGISRILFKICMRIMKKLRVSASECAHQLCHFNLRESSHKCVFLNTQKPEKRYKVLKFNESNRVTSYFVNIFECYKKQLTEYPDYDFNNMSLL